MDLVVSKVYGKAMNMHSETHYQEGLQATMAICVYDELVKHDNQMPKETALKIAHDSAKAFLQILSDET